MLEIVATVVVWAGIVLVAAGLLSLIKPLRFLRIRTRKRGLAVAGIGVLSFLIGAHLPSQIQHVAASETHIDKWMPAFQFSEFHSRRVHATPEQIYRAIREVTPDEIFLFRTLTWIRNPRRPARGVENILNAPGQKPILDVAMKGGFRLLAEDAPREIVLGTLVMWDGVSLAKDEAELRALLARPGNAFSTINFRVVDEGNGWCVVSTETRVLATDAGARRRFARYWRVIYPGSSLLRFTWLRAIARRAQKHAPPEPVARRVSTPSRNVRFAAK